MISVNFFIIITQFMMFHVPQKRTNYQLPLKTLISSNQKLINSTKRYNSTESEQKVNTLKKNSFNKIFQLNEKFDLVNINPDLNNQDPSEKLQSNFKKEFKIPKQNTSKKISDKKIEEKRKLCEFINLSKNKGNKEKKNFKQQKNNNFNKITNLKKRNPRKRSFDIVEEENSFYSNRNDTHGYLPQVLYKIFADEEIRAEDIQKLTFIQRKCLEAISERKFKLRIK